MYRVSSHHLGLILYPMLDSNALRMFRSISCDQMETEV